MGFAPVVVFGYNRAEHLKLTLQALENNRGADQSEIFLFLDGCRGKKDQKDVELVAKVANTYKKKKVFKSFCVIKKENNIGLADSIIYGVSKIIEVYGRVIVLEDDLITSKDFLQFMNESLEYYKERKEVWSIAAFSFQMKNLSHIKEDVYLGYRAASWGWATWNERWATVDWEVKDYSKFRYNLLQRYQFNKGGTDMSNMLDRQMAGEINSWAIRWCYAQYKQGKVTVFPRKSKILNQGMDGTGTHCTVNDKFDANEFGENPYKLCMPYVNRKITKEFQIRTGLALTSRFKRYLKYNVFGQRRT